MKTFMCFAPINRNALMAPQLDVSTGFKRGNSSDLEELHKSPTPLLL